MKPIKILKESGEYHDNPHFQIHWIGDKPQTVVIFEKSHVYQWVIDSAKINNALFVCTNGVASKECLHFLNSSIKSFKPSRIIFVADLDPTSMFEYLVLSQGRRSPNPKAKMKHNIEFRMTYLDYERYLHGKGVDISLWPGEKEILSFVELFNLPNLKKEIEFLNHGAKTEIEGLKARDMLGVFLADVFK